MISKPLYFIKNAEYFNYNLLRPVALFHVLLRFVILTFSKIASLLSFYLFSFTVLFQKVVSDGE